LYTFIHSYILLHTSLERGVLLLEVAAVEFSGAVIQQKIDKTVEDIINFCVFCYRKFPIHLAKLFVSCWT